MHPAVSPVIRRLAALALVALLAGCGGQNCDRPELYQSARSAPPLEVPADLSTPPSHAAQKVPDLPGGNAPPVGGCLDRPPRFLAVAEETTPASAPVQAAAAAPAPAAPTGPFSVGPAAATPQQQIEDMIDAWARAWGRADAEGVLEYYASTFDAGDFGEAEDWLATRRDTVAASRAERVLIEALEISDLTVDTATVRFVQHFITGGEGSAVVKEMIVAVDGDRWRIASEAVIDVL